MTNKLQGNLIPFLWAVALFIGLGIVYEYQVYRWTISSETKGPLIRVDIFIVYPVFILLSGLLFFWLKKRRTKRIDDDK